MLELKTLREFYCIRCHNLHKVDIKNHFLRILSTGYHIVSEQRYQTCICNPSGLSTSGLSEGTPSIRDIYNIKD
ncbi:hypothetical protein J2T20_002315 [Paenibacillus wynnii]|nr:hypothetical protein [Paenibacillus wynnii]